MDNSIFIEATPENMAVGFASFDPVESAKAEARALLDTALAHAVAAHTLPTKEPYAYIVETPADNKNGDIAANLALAGARVFGMAPRKIAEVIAAEAEKLIENSCFAKLEIAGPGFINLFLSPAWYGSVVMAANLCGDAYGRTDAGEGKKVNVEFVSANPTGPMHLGNARGGALGDCLAAALDWAGYDVTREFYINDAGNQILKFGKSLAIRYQQKFGGEEAYPLPEDCYQGADITALAQEFAGINGDAYMAKPFEELQQAITDYALPKNIAGLQRDLGKYRIAYDTWFRESTLHNGAIQEVLDKLAARGATYEKDGAVWYRSTQYAAKYGANLNARKGQDGEVNDEDKDEVLVRANGVPTYFAADIAYHYNKFVTRGFDTAIDVWGADHHGHVARMKGAMDAVGLDGEKLEIVLMQFVRLLQDGQPVRMSKRTGKAITLSTLLDEVPIDSARFFFNQREAGSVVDFDLDLAARQDSDNPVYYVQYAHARICTMLKKLAEEGVEFAGVDACNGELYTEDSERALVRLVARFPGEIVGAANSRDPARLTRYAVDAATAFHKFYNACRVKDAEPAVQQARMGLCLATKNVLANVLTMMKISVPESM